VYIIKVNSIPKGLTKKDSNILLSGEATGHHHRLGGGTIFAEEPTKDNGYSCGYFNIQTETPLTHEEHKKIMLKPGKYRFYQQREWDEQEERRVVD
jgi:hypothetical protein